MLQYNNCEDYFVIRLHLIPVKTKHGLRSSSRVVWWRRASGLGPAADGDGRRRCGCARPWLGFGLFGNVHRRFGSTERLKWQVFGLEPSRREYEMRTSRTQYGSQDRSVQAKLSGECISGSSYCKPETVLASDPIENPNNKSFKKEISTSAKGCW